VTMKWPVILYPWFWGLRRAKWLATSDPWHVWWVRNS